MLSRRRGHTTAAIQGVRESGATYVALHHAHARMIKDEFNVNVVPFDPEMFRGRANPFVFDHAVVERLYYQLEDVKARLYEAEAKLERIRSIIS